MQIDTKNRSALKWHRYKNGEYISTYHGYHIKREGGFWRAMNITNPHNNNVILKMPWIQHANNLKQAKLYCEIHLKDYATVVTFRRITQAEADALYGGYPSYICNEFPAYLIVKRKLPPGDRSPFLWRLCCNAQGLGVYKRAKDAAGAVGGHLSALRGCTANGRQ